MPVEILLALALILDALVGEPALLWQRLPHPVVLIGRAIAFFDQMLNRGSLRKIKGMVAIVAICVLAFASGALLVKLPLSPLWQLLLAAVLLAWRSLADHVAAVAAALTGSLPEARAALARIVGRDTAEMDEAAIARAAIESAAENFSDGVIAPAFWFLLFGLPGMLLYKTINTADSMIGYRNERYEEFGWAAARLDDLANWVPARLSALLIALSGAVPLRLWSTIAAEARRHRSPNAGWPEAAMARALGVALAGPRRYGGTLHDEPFIHPCGSRSPGATEIRRAIRLLWRAWGLFLALLLAFFFIGRT